MKVVLVSPYEIGRQPFSLAQPAAWLKNDGFNVKCVDLSVETFDLNQFKDADLIAVHLAMHAGARLAAEIIAAIHENFRNIVLCAYGLYAPVNQDYFRSLGVKHVFGGECEPDLLALCRSLRSGLKKNSASATLTRLDKIGFVVPDRSGLPSLAKYSQVVFPGNANKTVGFVEGSRGCKHLCRHCPVVPVYKGKFRVVPVDVVLEDIRQQVEAGAEHISFGDPDFLNGPTHARRIVKIMNKQYPDISWDATVKVEHILQNKSLLAEFSDMRCKFITSAVESIEDKVLLKLEKGHTASDFVEALGLLRNLGIALVPTFVPFTPWTTLTGYQRLLKTCIDLQLVNAVAPVQLSIRLLLPQGSRLLEIARNESWLNEFNPELLGYQWTHPDAKVDMLQTRVQDWVIECEDKDRSRAETFFGIWSLTHEMLESKTPTLPTELGEEVPHMTEPWYCCAEPVDNQLLHA